MRLLLPAAARPALLGATSAARCATPLAVAAAPVAAAPALAPTVLIGGALLSAALMLHEAVPMLSDLGSATASGSREACGLTPLRSPV